MTSTDLNNMKYEGAPKFGRTKSKMVLLLLFALPTGGITLIGCLVLYLRCKFTTYKIDESYLKIKKGVLSTTINTMELWKIQDLVFKQSLIQKILGESQIVIASQDKSSPITVMDGFSAAEGKELFEKLQSAVTAARKNNKVVALTA